MNNYIIKNILLFISVVIISIVMVGLVQLYSFDNQLIRERISKLEEINHGFETKIPDSIKSKFSLINFLAKTSYPNVAVDFGMYQQFYDIIDDLSADNDLLGVILFDSKGHLISKKIFNGEIDFEIEKFENEHEQIIFGNDHTVFITPFFADNALAGLIGGIKQNSSISKSLEAAYYEETINYLDLKPVISWYRENKNEKNPYLFLCDYELLGNKENGLDVIEQLGIGNSSILVTSRFEEEDVKKGCEKLGVKLLPKNLAGFVPIILEKRDDKEGDVEYVLIDIVGKTPPFINREFI